MNGNMSIGDVPAREALDALSSPAYILSAIDFSLVYANQAARYLSEEDRSPNWACCQIFQDNPRICRACSESCPLKKVLSTGESVVWRPPQQDLEDGSAFEVKVSPLCDEEGNLRWMLEQHHGVPSGVGGEEERPYIEAIWRTTKDAVGVLDSDGALLFGNPAHDRLFPDGAGEHPNAPSSRGGYPDWARTKIQEEGLPRARREGRWHGQIAYRDGQGQEIPASQFIQAHYNSQGEAAWLSTVIRGLPGHQEVEARLRQERDFTSATLSSLPGVFYLLDQKGQFLRWNRQFEEVSGFTQEEMARAHPLDFFQGADKERIAQAIDQVFREGSVQVEAELVPKTGSPVPHYFTGLLVELAGQHYLAGLGMDITRRKEMEDRLRQIAKVFESTQEGVLITDEAARILTVNDAFTNITGYTEEEVVGETPRILQSEYHDKAFYKAMWAEISEKGVWQGEIWDRRKDGTLLPTHQSISTVWGPEGEVTNYVGVFSDITRIKESEDQLRHLAHHDPLTNLPNRLLFRDRLGHALARADRQDHDVAILFLDLEGFKHVNDSLGHTIGDGLLGAVAKRLEGNLRAEDTIGRLGGDEFAILLEDLSGKEDAARVADKLNEAMAAPFVLDQVELGVGASIGISLYPDDGRDVEALLKNADAAMYRAKENGRNTHRFFAREMTDQAMERVFLEAELRGAIRKGELVLHFQPQMSLKTEKVSGVEALVRWNHPEKGLIFPGQFIPLAEESGLIIKLGEWVLWSACYQAKSWLEEGVEFGRMAVNVAAPQVVRGNFAETVDEILREIGLPGERLLLEVTETSLMDQGEVAEDQISRIRALNVGVAIDDFGTGFSSLAYLKRLPIDQLKLDKQFVSQLPHDPHDVAIARTVISMGQAFGLEVLAEGVEEEQQRRFLLEQGCPLGQGFLWGKPSRTMDFSP